nr:atp-dependent 6-phosphofructokinase 3 [Quercus suber]
MHGLGYVVDVGEAQNAQLKKRIHLHSLELDFYIEDQFQEKGEESRRRMESDLAVLNVLEPPSHLEKLSIKSFMGTTVYTNWMMSLTNLKSLHIDGCWQLECLPPLGSNCTLLRLLLPISGIEIYYHLVLTQVCVIKGCGTQKMASMIFEEIRRGGLTVEVEIPKTVDNSITVLLKACSTFEL